MDCLVAGSDGAGKTEATLGICCNFKFVLGVTACDMYRVENMELRSDVFLFIWCLLCHGNLFWAESQFYNSAEW